MSAFDEPQKELYAEAVRTIPGVLAARHRGDREDVVTLLDAYFAAARQRGISQQKAWSVLFSATMAQMSAALTDLSAANPGSTVEETIQRLASTAALWVADTRGVSGY